MQTQTVNLDEAEIMYGAFKNVDGSGSITTGYALAFTTTAASLNGHNAVLPATGQVLTFAGVAAEDVAINASGRYIAYGYAASVRIEAVGSSVTVAVGIAMGPTAAKVGVNSTGSRDTNGPVVAMQAIGAAILSPGGWAKGFVRAM